MRDTPQAVMLFAAGFGTRMQALTADRPKPMIEVAGKPLIDHALHQIETFAPLRVVANLHYKPDVLRDHLAGRPVLFSDERDDILETGGGLRKALPLLGTGPVFTMNSDAVWAGENPLQRLANAWDPTTMDALLLCIPRDNAIGHSGQGDFLIDEQGRATRGPGLVYSGLQIIKTDSLDQIEEKAFSLNILWNLMMPKGRFFALPYTGKWCDVGTPTGITLAETMLAAGDDV